MAAPGSRTHVRKVIVPRGMVLPLGVFILSIGLPFVHVGLPWGLSLLAARHGWVTGRPSVWNWVGLAPAAIGMAGIIWVVAVMLFRVPQLPPKVEVGLTAQVLITTGPFAWSRNPIYVAGLILWLGWTVFYGSLAVLIGIMVGLLLARFVIVPYEERSLEARFGEGYLQYKRTVRRWVGRAGNT